MHIFQIIEYLIFGAMGLLFIWAVYTFIKYFKEILFGIFRYLKYEITSSLIFLPISVLIWVINKKITAESMILIQLFTKILNMNQKKHYSLILGNSKNLFVQSRLNLMK